MFNHRLHRWNTDKQMLEIDESEKPKLLHEETTGKIIGAAFEVRAQLGDGFLERVYQRALQVELLRGATAEVEKRVQVQYKGVIVGDYDVDLFVDETEGYVRQNRAQQFKRWRQLCPFAGRNIHIAAL